MRRHDPHEATDDLLEIPGLGGGRELLRVAAEDDGAYRLLSVPVCALGLSRGTRVAAAAPGAGA